MAIGQANSDACVFSCFMTKLLAKLESEDKHFRWKTRVLIDNAKYHTVDQVTERLKLKGCNTHFLGPYSWETSPCEYVFAWYKSTNNNEDRLLTGKK